MGKAAYAFSLALITGLTFGCTQSGSQIDYADFDPSYNSQNFGNYHKDRDTRVVIIGSTLGEAPAVFGRMVTDAMQGQNRGGRTNFTTIPGASAEDNLRVVMAFDVAPYGNSICDGHIPKPVKTPGVTTVQGAWCWGNRVQSYVSARTKATNAANPEFRRLIGDVTREMFPQNLRRKLDENSSDHCVGC